MASFNQSIIIGNLTRDPEMRYTPSGTPVCDLSVAVNEKWKDKDGQMKEDVNFIDCTAWGRTAEVAAEYLKKGRPVMIVGRLKQDRWDDKNTGQKRSKLKITVTTIQFLGAKGGKGGDDAPPTDDERADAEHAQQGGPDDDSAF